MADDAQYDPLAGLMTPDQLAIQRFTTDQQQRQALADSGNVGALAGRIAGGGINNILQQVGQAAGAPAPGPDPAMAAAQQNQQVMAQANTNDPDKLEQLAQQPGIPPDLAQRIMNKAQMLRKAKNDMDAKTADANYKDLQAKQLALEIARGGGHLATAEEIADYKSRFGPIPAGHALAIDKDGTPKLVGDNPREPPKAEFKTVNLPNGLQQDMWIMPGATTGTPVGEPHAAGQNGMGSAQGKIQFARLVRAYTQGSADAHNLSRLPWDTTSGILGTHPNSSSNPLSIGMSALQNKISPTAAGLFTTFAAGIQRNLAAIEASGVNVNKNLTDSMNAVLAQPGQSQLTMMSKMAQIRQIIDNGIMDDVANPFATPAQIELLKKIQTQLQKDIPFTNDDVMDLYNNQFGEKATLKDVVFARQHTYPDEASAEAAAKADPSIKGKVIIINGRQARLS